MIASRLLALCLLLVTATAAAAPKWVWLSKKALNNEQVTFRHRFDLPHNAHFASLEITCDNGAKVYLNGELVATNPDWQFPTKVDATKFIKPAETNELRVEASNKGGTAALVARLTVRLANMQELLFETSEAWEASPAGKDEWRPAVAIADYGSGPWGKALEAKAAKPGKGGTAIAAEDITVPEGFQVDQLYVVPKDAQGSWVALTVDPRGRLIACDQYGGLYRMDLPPVEEAKPLLPEPLQVAIGKAHGLLHAFDSLYVMVNEDRPNNGLYRLRDTTGDDQYDKVEKLVTMDGGGEHGLHSMAVSPDGNRIFFNGGNHTHLPDELSRSRPAELWAEDHLLPRMWDANGHARGTLAPGGFIASMNPDGTDVELYCHGFRNEFDIAFNAAGDLFTYDADMEWDIGTPWYRPTRVNHCVSGADYGWRSGSGKWPGHYPDSLPTTIDIGPGSPTGVASGLGSKFPAKYQRAIFINDWTYGTMWAIHLVPDGASYAAEKEEFLFGKPLPLTDVVVHPGDGAMYFATGGRRTQSAVYRVRYVGKDSTEPASPPLLTEEMQMRRMLEALHSGDAEPVTALDKAWPYLSHSDRHLRYAARVAIERQPVKLWQERALAETHPQALIEATIALARATARPQLTFETKPKPGESMSGIQPVAPENAALQEQMLQALDRLDLQSLSRAQLLGGLRALSLVFTRLGKPDFDICNEVASRLESTYPTGDPVIDRELCQALVFLDSAIVVSKTIALMATATDDWEDLASHSVLSRHDGYARAAQSAASSRPNRQQIAFMFALRNATEGWTPELRRTFFSWFPRARTWKGGNSFKGFIENIRQEALARFVPEKEIAALEELSGKVVGGDIPNFVAPKGPGRAWSIDEVVTLTAGGFKKRDFANGEAMFRSTMCLTCHRFNGDGGGIGPDITGAANRYTMRDLMENIVEPSKVVSDQYDSQLIEKKDGTSLLGRIVVEEDGKLLVMTNPFAPNDLVSVRRNEVTSIKTQPVSLMPPGLINALNQDELLDLLAYIMTGGNPDDPAFQ